MYLFRRQLPKSPRRASEATAHIPDATAAALPPELPPAQRLTSKGFFTGPK